MSAANMSAQGLLLQQHRPVRALKSAPQAARLQRGAQRIVSQAQPARPAQPSRPKTALQAAAVAEARETEPAKHTSRVCEKGLGEGQTIVNGQV